MQADHPAQTCRKRRETVFFDLDDTLYDRAVPYLAAFRQFFGGRYEDRAAQAFDAVIRRGYEVFKPAHTGQITMEQMHIYRHQTGLGHLRHAGAGASGLPPENFRTGRIKYPRVSAMPSHGDVCFGKFRREA